MIYLAQPYSHPHPDVRELRYEMALKVCATYAKRGSMVYSPIVHWHNVALEYPLPKDAKFWERLNHKMMDIANRMHVMKLDGWRESVGLTEEIEYAKEIGLVTDWIEEEEV